jgi:hypothetical protein
LSSAKIRDLLWARSPDFAPTWALCAKGGSEPFAARAQEGSSIWNIATIVCFAFAKHDM